MSQFSRDIAIQVVGLTKRFGSFTAVDALDFAVGRGEIFGFLGPNGAGKSTTIRMLCGLLKPTDGTGVVAGYDIRTRPEAIKRHIGYMSQRFSLYEDLTVAENIDFYGGIYGLTKRERSERMAYILEMAGLRGREASLAGELSGGWKQRLALGCATVHRPEILFLDEPTSGTDPISRRNFWDLIYRAAEGGTTVFVTTHYMDEAEHCDRLGFIYGGKLIALGAPDELKERYRGELLEVGCEPLMDGLAVLGRLPDVSDVALFGARLHVTVSNLQTGRPAIESALRQERIRVLGIERVEPTLEDVFVSLMEAQEQATS